MNRFALTESFAPCQVYGCRLHRLSFRCIEDVWLDIDRVTEYIHLTFKVVLDGECVDCVMISSYLSGDAWPRHPTLILDLWNFSGAR